MRKMTVDVLMTREVITVVPDTSFSELAGLMVCRDLDVVAVIDPLGRPVGTVSECDLLAKLEFHGGIDHRPVLASAYRRARWRKSTGRTAGDLMSSPVIALRVDSGLETAARVFADCQHRRLCVIDLDDHLIGMLNRTEVLAVFLRGDEVLRDELSALIAALATPPRYGVEVIVKHGIARLEGLVRLRSDADELVRRIRLVPGLVGLECLVRYDIDDSLITGI